MKTLSLILIIWSLAFGTATAQDAVGANSREKKVLKLVNALPEVVQANRERSRQRQLSAYIESVPTSTRKYYSVSVCDTFADRLFAYFRFRVYPPNNTIYYDDLETGKFVPLKKWHQHPYGIYGTRPPANAR